VFPSEYQPDTVHIQRDFIEGGESVTSLSQRQDQRLAVNGNFVDCHATSSMAEGEKVCD